MSGASRYLTKSQCSHRENYRTVHARASPNTSIRGLCDLKFRGYAVKRKSPAKSRDRNPRIKIVGKSKMPIDFLPPPAANCRTRRAGKTSKKTTRWKFSFAWADPSTSLVAQFRNDRSRCNSDGIVYRLRKSSPTVFAG